MYKPLLVLLMVSSQISLSACTVYRVQVAPLTEEERQTLGTIGIAAEVSRLATQYSRDSTIIDDRLRDIQDRLSDAGQGAIKGFKKGGLVRINRCLNEECLVGVLFNIAIMTARGIAGGVDGALHRKTYSTRPVMELPEKAAMRAVQESIDALGLPAQLRDEIWEKAQKYSSYNFAFIEKLPSDPRNTQDEYGSRSAEARYWPLRDKGIQTILKVRIPLIEFRGSQPDAPYQLLVHVETTLVSTQDRSCIRRMGWEYQGENHYVTEWNKDNAKLFVADLNRGFNLIAQRVMPALFEKTADISPEALDRVLPKSELLVCLE